MADHDAAVNTVTTVDAFDAGLDANANPRMIDEPTVAGGTPRGGWVGAARRTIVFVVGATVVSIGVALLVLPGPGLLVIIAGLGILAREFVWARTLLSKAQAKAKLASDKARAAASRSARSR